MCKIGKILHVNLATTLDHLGVPRPDGDPMMIPVQNQPEIRVILVENKKKHLFIFESSRERAEC